MGDGKADAVVAQKSGKPDQGVGKPVGLADAVAEKLMLTGARSAGSEGHFDAFDSRRETQGFQLGLERCEQHVGVGTGLRKIDLYLFQMTVFKLHLNDEPITTQISEVQITAYFLNVFPEKENEGLRLLDWMIQLID